ncbi:Hypothetical predicted protein [Mytilus galloprovincialis]|uniref:CUE domain-containing protein n=1 Tax=Mytilus galloprovincialis TaxID=29158 RepID=A0A8B6EE18_MYTGA|nr:Hypothetical predicted protein [Mytilus galloprovincialis]
MSKTFTSKPAAVRSRNPNNQNQAVGRGTVPKTTSNRGRGAMATGGRNLPTGAGRGSLATGGRNLPTGAGRGSLASNSDAENLQPQQQPLDQRMSYQGGYTMISPNEKKRQEIQRQADKETASYQQYKEQKKVGPLSYVGTAGGGAITEQQARNRLIQDNKNPSMKLREKREIYKTEQKKKEDEEIELKRKKQRDLADKNKLKSHQTEADKRNKWDEDRRRKTDDFLSRLERKPNEDRQPGSGNTEFKPRGSDTVSSNAVASVQPVSEVDTPNNLRGAHAYSNTNMPVSNDLDTLHVMFPHCDRATLQDILQHNSLESAIDLLT